MTTTEVSTGGDYIADIDVDLIDAGNNDRKIFDDDELAELAASIADVGLAQRITVRAKGDRFEIVAGERRFRAIAHVNRSATAPCVVRVLDDEQASKTMLAENVSRSDLDAVAEGRAYQKRIDEFGISASEVADWAGVSTARVATRLPLVNLIDEAADLVSKGHLSVNHGKSMSDLDGNRQRLALKAVADGNLTYFAFSDLCQRLRNEQAADGQTFGFTVDEYVADAKEGRAKAARFRVKLIADLADALADAGLADELVAEAREAIA